jgi:DNA-binding NarL/FixJ family response regulator
MSERIPVIVYARDPVSKAGLASQLRGRPELHLVEDEADAHGAVAIVVSDEVDQFAATRVKALARNGNPRVILVVARLDDGSLLSAVESGVCGILLRSSASAEALSGAVTAAAAGDGSLPPDLLGRLLKQLGRLQETVLGPRGLTFSGLTEREAEVLRLVADGLDTAEVAERLYFSERTVKNVLHDMTTRLGLRNRTHAVAYAVRQGLI